MADRITVNGAAVGAAGAQYRKLLTYTAKAIGNYPLSEANFAGLGVWLPCQAVISLNAPASCTLTVQISTDNGTTWFTLVSVAATTQGGIYLMLDTAVTFRVTVAGAAGDIRIFIQ